MKANLTPQSIPGRFLSPEEEDRFRATLDSREEKIRVASSSNSSSFAA